MTEAELDVPFNRSYWVIPGKLMAGCYPGSENPAEAQLKLGGLLDCGIRHVIDLMSSHEVNHFDQPFNRYTTVLKAMAEDLGLEVTFDRIAVRDMTAPSKNLMINILDRIDYVMATGRPAYVHCWGGRGRTGTVVGCYLARHGIASGNKALEYIKTLRRRTIDHYLASPETPEQVRMVVSWGEGW